MAVVSLLPHALISIRDCENNFVLMKSVYRGFFAEQWTQFLDYSRELLGKLQLNVVPSRKVKISKYHVC